MIDQGAKMQPVSHDASFVVHAERRIAYDSPDHLMPHGTRRDNSRNLEFNRRLALLMRKTRLPLLDMGCSGGGFVKSWLDEGYVAVGLEGSDYSQRHGRAEWPVIPHNLFTCDVTADFRIVPTGNQNAVAAFDIVTAWEMMEHIRTADLPKVCDNVSRHLAPGGLWIMSIAPINDIINGVELHQTVQRREWWIHMFAEQGFQNHPHLVKFFGDDWVRGRFQGAPVSFHLVLTRRGENPPPLPPAFVRLKLAVSSAVRHAPARTGLLLAKARSGVGRVLKPVLKPLLRQS